MSILYLTVINKMIRKTMEKNCLNVHKHLITYMISASDDDGGDDMRILIDWQGLWSNVNVISTLNVHIFNFYLFAIKKKNPAKKRFFSVFAIWAWF